MDLKGTMTEREFRKELIGARKSLFEEQLKKRIFNFIQTNYDGTITAYTLDWTLGQGEEIYSVLLNIKLVITVEIDRFDTSEPPNLLEAVTISEDKKG